MSLKPNTTLQMIYDFLKITYPDLRMNIIECSNGPYFLLREYPIDALANQCIKIEFSGIRGVCFYLEKDSMAFETSYIIPSYVWRFLTRGYIGELFMLSIHRNSNTFVKEVSIMVNEKFA